jgi:hypothetical protein
MVENTELAPSVEEALIPSDVGLPVPPAPTVIE